MKRKSSLRRRSRLSAKRWGVGPSRRKSRYRQRERNFPYMQWAKAQPCCAPTRDCDGVIEAAHVGERGLGKKAPDETCIPLCKRHHIAHGECKPPFRGWTKLERRWWNALQVAAHRTRYEKRVEIL